MRWHGNAFTPLADGAVTNTLYQGSNCILVIGISGADVLVGGADNFFRDGVAGETSTGLGQVDGRHCFGGVDAGAAHGGQQNEGGKNARVHVLRWF